MEIHLRSLSDGLIPLTIVTSLRNQSISTTSNASFALQNILNMKERVIGSGILVKY